MLSSKCEAFALHVAYVWVAELFSKWGGNVHVKKIITFNMTSLTFVSMFKQFFSKFDKPLTIAICTTPDLSYSTSVVLKLKKNFRNGPLAIF